MQSTGIKKVVIIGPESTGKSTLCEQLAKHYNTVWCPEYARKYLLDHGNKYDYDDLLTIARGQINLEEECIEKVGNSGLVFIDTDMYVMKVWSEFVFGKCHRYILEQIVERKYDQYLLCNTDLPWVKDELREYPDMETRQKLFMFYKDIMINQSTPWTVISGASDIRLQMASEVVNSLLKD